MSDKRKPVPCLPSYHSSLITYHLPEVFDEDDARRLDAAGGDEAVVARPVEGGDVVGGEVRELHGPAARERLQPDVRRPRAGVEVGDAAVVGQPDCVRPEGGGDLVEARRLAAFDGDDGEPVRGERPFAVRADEGLAVGRDERPRRRLVRESYRLAAVNRNLPH